MLPTDSFFSQLKAKNIFFLSIFPFCRITYIITSILQCFQLQKTSSLVKKRVAPSSAPPEQLIPISPTYHCGISNIYMKRNYHWHFTVYQRELALSCHLLKNAWHFHARAFSIAVPGTAYKSHHYQILGNLIMMIEKP